MESKRRIEGAIVPENAGRQNSEESDESTGSDPNVMTEDEEDDSEEKFETEEYGEDEEYEEEDQNTMILETLEAEEGEVAFPEVDEYEEIPQNENIGDSILQNKENIKSNNPSETVLVVDEQNYNETGTMSEARLELPKMKSRFAMSNQQIRDLIDPNNQVAFNDNINKISLFLANAQKEYCELNFKENKEAKVFRLRKELLENLVYEHELDLAGNFLHQTVGRRLCDEDMADIAEFLMKDTEVTRLNFAYNDFSDEGIMILAGILLIRWDIAHINLSHNNFTPTGCYHLIEYLMNRPALHSLKLSGMKLGEEGFNGLICLFMCGRGPFDLDVSETDLQMASFQGLCTAWQAIDHDQDFPKYLTGHPLPIPLGVLAEMKVANNQDKKKEQSLLHRRSFVDLVTNDDVDDKLDRTGESSKGGRDPVGMRVMENFSATILQGLFEIPQIQVQHEQQRDLIKVKTGLEKAVKGKVEKLVKESQEMPDTGLIIEEFKKIHHAGCMNSEPDGKPVIVCPSFYSLDVDNVLQAEVDDVGHFIPTALDDMIIEARIKTKLQGIAPKAPDDETAIMAATETANQVFEEAALFSSATDYQEKSDTAQLLLSVVLDTCQQLVSLENADAEFQEMDLQSIWELATQNAAEIFRNSMPEGQCSLSHNQVMGFVRKFMESTNRTLLSLLQNPFIPPLLFDVGTKSCYETLLEEKAFSIEHAASSFPIKKSQSASSFRPNYVQKIVMNFLEGAISEAANIIGSGDPYSFRNSTNTSESLEATLEKSKNICDETERHIEGVMNDFILAGSLLAKEANSTRKELELAQENSVEPAAEFLEKTFQRVAELIIQMENSSRAAADETKAQSKKFTYISRPARLVLNRPLFQDYEAIMAAKMGDFLRDNITVKCLHMRKWNFGEDGMIQLMDGLVHNTNIVLLDLASNAIGPEGTKCLATFVKENPSLKHLLLNHNRLRNPGLTYLTEALPHSNLEFINIAYNDISDSLDNLMEVLPKTKIKALHVLGNLFSQTTWTVVRKLLDSKWLNEEFCDFTLQEVDGNGMIVKNSQTRDLNEWYDVPPVVAHGLRRAPYFEENAHLLAPKF